MDEPSLERSVPHERYDFDDKVGEVLGLPSAGPLAVMTADQLHPMMVLDPLVWSDGSRWVDAAEEHVRQIAQHCNLQVGMRVLDIGCGLGGPARLLEREFGVSVVQLNLVERQLASSRELGGHAGREFVVADANTTLPFADASFDAVWSMNMAYHVADHEKMITEAARVLRPNGRFMLDDWMFTQYSSAEDRATMELHFGSGNLFSVQSAVEHMHDAGLPIRYFSDVGAVGRSLMGEHLETTVRRDFLPEMSQLDPTWGAQTALDFIDSILETVRLYRENRMTYVQCVGVRSASPIGRPW